MTERTKVLFLSHITSPTALLFPIESLIAEARKRGIFSVIDGAHTPGHIPLNLDALGADFYSGNCHKWLMSPKGSAFLYARPERQAMLDPLVISHGWTADNKEPGVARAVRQFGLRRRDRNAGDARSRSLARGAGRHRLPAGARLVAGERGVPPAGTGNGRAAASLTGLPPFASPELCAPQMVAIPTSALRSRWIARRPARTNTASKSPSSNGGDIMSPVSPAKATTRGSRWTCSSTR